MANIPQRNNNPGNLKDPKTGTFRTFASADEGFNALNQDLTGKMTGKTSTGLTPQSSLADFANVYAPASDKNDPTGYAQKLADQLKVPVTHPIGQLASRVNDFSKAIANNEGFFAKTAYADEIPQTKVKPDISSIPQNPAPPQLSHEQLIANINAMEKQGAKQPEVQGYLDDLKKKNHGSAALLPGQEGYVDPNAQGPGFLMSMYKGVADPVANMIARPGQLAVHAFGDETPQTGDFFGATITDPYADVANGKSPMAAITSDVGRAAETVALGMGAVKGGATLLGGAALEHNDPLLPSVDHPLENVIAQTGIGAVGGKVLDVGVKYLGKGLSTFGEGLKTSAAAKALLDSAAQNWHNILNPTTKAFKTATEDIAKEMALRGEIFTSRGDFLRAAEERSNAAGDVIDTIWNSVPEGTKVNIEDVAKYMLKNMRDLQLTGGAGNQFVPIENEPLYNALDKKLQELIKLSDDSGQIEVNALRGWRQAGDAFIQKSKPYQFAASEADKATVGAAKSATKGARSALNDEENGGIKGLKDANHAFHIWDTAKDIMDATLLRKVGQNPSSLTETIGAAGGLAIGHESLSHALGYAALIKYATRLVRSTLFQSTSAAVKSMLAHGIMDNDGNLIVQALQLAAKGTGTVAKVAGDFLQGIPKGLLEIPQKDIPGTSEKALTEALGGGKKGPNDTNTGGTGDMGGNPVRPGTGPGVGTPGAGNSAVKKGKQPAKFLEGRNLDPQTLQRMPAAPASNTVVDSLIKYMRDVSPGLIIKDVTEKGGFGGFEDVSTKTLESLVGRKTISKQFLLDATNRPELKQAERDVLRRVLDDFNGVESGGLGAKPMPASKIEIPVQNFADKVKAELLPLDKTYLKNPTYEGVNLPDEFRGSVQNYDEHIYNSPIKTSAGSVHFRGAGQDSKNYFAHVRTENLPGDTRRVLELQSDLFQKGRLENELSDKTMEYGKDAAYNSQRFDARKSEIEKLEPYRNTWHERVIREEVKNAAQDGKKKLLFPTGETAMRVEGLAGGEGHVPQNATLGDTFEYGGETYRVIGEHGDQVEVIPDTAVTKEFPWTEARDEEIDHAKSNFMSEAEDGDISRFVNPGDKGGSIQTGTWLSSKFQKGYEAAVKKADKAGSKEAIVNFLNDHEDEIHKVAENEIHNQYSNAHQMAEYFNDNGMGNYTSQGDTILELDEGARGVEEMMTRGGGDIEVDTENPIYKFYEKEVGRYLAKKYGATKITDPQGVSWFEVKVPKEAAKLPVEAFAAGAIPIAAAQDKKGKKKAK